MAFNFHEVEDPDGSYSDLPPEYENVVTPPPRYSVVFDHNREAKMTSPPPKYSRSRLLTTGGVQHQPQQHLIGATGGRQSHRELQRRSSTSVLTSMTKKEPIILRDSF